MGPDDELCLCFHVSKRKVVNFLRVERPASPSQLSECFGAGTGCGWCRPFLRKLFEEARNQGLLQRGSGHADSTPGSAFQGDSLAALTPEEYAELRREFVRQGKGTPPGSRRD